MEVREWAQKIVDILCEQHNIPKIPVKVVDNLGSAQALFYEDGYYIMIEKDVEVEIIFHEFTHYLLALLRNAYILEESICDYSMDGLGTYAKENFKGMKELCSFKPGESHSLC